MNDAPHRASGHGTRLPPAPTTAREMSKKKASTATAKAGQDIETLLACYRAMLRIRKVEQRLSKLFADKEIPGFIHLSIGQESVPVGISRHLRDDDTIAATHRGHGQALAKGVDLNGFVAEMIGRESGICRGRGGSMHIAEAKVGMLGANGVIADGCTISVGAAQAFKLQKKRRKQLLQQWQRSKS